MAKQVLEILSVEEFQSKKGNKFPNAQCILHNEDGSIRVCTHMQFENPELLPLDTKGKFEIEWGAAVGFDGRLGAVIKSLKPVDAVAAVKSAAAAAKAA